MNALFGTVCKDCEDCEGCKVLTNEPMCLEEVEHSTAEGGKLTVEFLVIDPGYWRATTKSLEILECYNTEACLGGVTGREGFCKIGHEGPCQYRICFCFRIDFGATL